MERRPDWGAPCYPLAAAAVVVIAATVVPGAGVVAAAAVAEQQDQDNDPPPVVTAKAIAQTVIVTTHNSYLQDIFQRFCRSSHRIPLCKKGARKAPSPPGDGAIFFIHPKTSWQTKNKPAAKLRPR